MPGVEGWNAVQVNVRLARSSLVPSARRKTGLAVGVPQVACASALVAGHNVRARNGSNTRSMALRDPFPVFVPKLPPKKTAKFPINSLSLQCQVTIIASHDDFLHAIVLISAPARTIGYGIHWEKRESCENNRRNVPLSEPVFLGADFR